MNREKNLETCLVITTGLIVLWLIYPIKGLLWAAIAIGIIGAFIDPLAHWVNWVWYKIAEVMGAIMSSVLLSIVFFGFLFPLALLSRLFNGDSLQLTKKDKGGSYWTERNHAFKGKDLEDMW